MPKIFIIILNWNGFNDTTECLESLTKIDYPRYEVIVVDNASTDGSVQGIRQGFPKVCLVENRKNKGFAAGNNVGIQYALHKGADFILVLNNDTIIDHDIINFLIEGHKSLSVAGFIGCKIYFHDEPQKLQYFGGLIEESPDLRGYHPEEGLFDDGSFREIKSTQYVTGCAMFASREVWEKTGGFDENYFLYWEDSDISLRAQKLGYTNYVIPDALVYHKVGSSSGGGGNPLTRFYGSRNRIYFARKHGFKFRAGQALINQLKTLLKTRWELRYTAALAELLACACGKLKIMGRAPRIVEWTLRSRLEARLRKAVFNLRNPGHGRAY